MIEHFASLLLSMLHQGSGGSKDLKDIEWNIIENVNNSLIVTVARIFMISQLISLFPPVSIFRFIDTMSMIKEYLF